MRLILLALVVCLAFAAEHEPFNGDEFCNELQEGSYCKHWLHVPVCQHIDIPCGGDAFCQRLRPDSYCKFWQNPPVCQHLDIPCAPPRPLGV
ncbi:hypothetical protein RCL1_006140 [Eukaryota sp. TZLM3-RCL]